MYKVKERRMHMSDKLKLMNTILQGIYIIATKMKDTNNFSNVDDKIRYGHNGGLTSYAACCAT